MYESIRPLYLQLYTHVRRVLRDKFGTDAVSADGPIPVHLLGKSASTSGHMVSLMGNIFFFLNNVSTLQCIKSLHPISKIYTYFKNEVMMSVK